MGQLQFKRNGMKLTKKEKKEIIDYCKKHPKQDNIVEFLRKKYKCSETNIVHVIVENRLIEMKELLPKDTKDPYHQFFFKKINDKQKEEVLLAIDMGINHVDCSSCKEKLEGARFIVEHLQTVEDEEKGISPK